jgi:hypothetical protein
MPKQVVTGALMTCSFGAAPSTFVATPRPVMSSYMTVGIITDNIPIANISPFGMCTSLANPSVAAATSAALGVLTPMPCIPNTPSPWTPGSPTHIVTGIPALNDTCKLMCLWAGVISITYPGQVTEDIP